MKKQTEKITIRERLKKPKTWYILTGVLLLAFLLAWGIAFLLTTRGPVEARIQGDQGQHEVDRPLVVKLNRQLGSVRPSLSPAVEGVWKEKRRLFGVAELEFTPTRSLDADTEYTLHFHDVRRALFGGAQLVPQRFRTQKAPRIERWSLDDKQVIAMDESLSVTLGSRAGKLRQLELSVEPHLELKRHSSDDTTFTWSYDGVLSADAEYTFVLRDTVQREELRRMAIKTAPLPTLQSSVKEHSVAPSDELKLVFSEAILSEGRPNISFTAQGEGAWRNDTEYVFKPRGLEPGKTYTYTIPKGLRTARGGILQEPLQKSFATNGRVAAVGIWPRNKVVNQAAQDVSVTFNQEVDHKSAEQRFRVSAGELRGFSWRGTTLTARVVNMGYQRHVQAWVEPGVVPVFGLPNSEKIVTSFTTDSRVVKLNVPYYKQVFAQSCEAASLRMALAYRGIHDSDWNILQKFGYNPRPRDHVRNVWDDPNQQFVGDVKGNQGAGTGWGVYAGPVARAAGQYGRGTNVAYGADAHFVARQIHAGNPVIAWGVWRLGAKIDSWTTPGGRTVSGPIPMHVRLIVGVRGEPHDPIGFYVHDPIVGQLYWTRSHFTAMTAGAGPAAQLLVVQ